MKTFTFTFFADDDKVYGYLFNITRAEAQETVGRINKETGEHHYYTEGYLEIDSQ